MSKTEVSGKQLKDGSVELVDLAPEVSGVLDTLQSDVATLQTDVAAKADAGNLASVATSGSYNDLSDKPSIPSVAGLASETYVDTAVAGKADSASLATVATSGSYTDLTNKPSLFSGDYGDLANKPTIPSVVGLASETYVDTAVAAVVNSAPAVLDTLNELSAALGNDENFATTVAGQIGDVASDVSALDVRVTAVEADVASIQGAATPNLSDLGEVAITTPSSGQVLKYDGLGWVNAADSTFSGVYADLTSKPTLFDGAYSSLTGAPSLFSGSYTDLTSKPTLFDGAYASLTGKPSLATVATSGSYNDLTDTPAAGASNLDGLSDVVITSAAKGHFIAHNGTNFVNTRTLEADAAATTPLSLKGAASQSANLLEVQDSAGTVLASISAGGAGTFNGGVRLKAGGIYDTSNLGATYGVTGTGSFGGSNYTHSFYGATNQPTMLVGSSGIYPAIVCANGVNEIFRTSQYGTSITPRSFETWAVALTVNNNHAGPTTIANFQSNSVTKVSFSKEGNITASGTGTFNAPAAASKGLIVKGAVSQTANVFEVQASNGGAYLYVNNNHTVFMQATAATEKTLIVRSGSNGDSAAHAHALDIQNGWGNTVAYVKPTGSAYFSTTLASVVPLTAKGAASQTANLFETQNSSGTALTYIDPNGYLKSYLGYVNSVYVGIRNNSRAVYIGDRAGESNAATSQDNVAVGFEAARYNTTGYENVVVGKSAMGAANSTAYRNTAVGYYAGAYMTSAFANTLIGHLAGTAITTATWNTLVGKDAGAALTTSGGNTFIGGQAGLAASNTTNAVFIGASCGAVGTDMARSVGVGVSAHKNGYDNVAIGFECGKNMTNQENQNVYIGTSAAQQGFHQNKNVIIGYNAQQANITYGGSQIAIGWGAACTGSTALAIGVSASAADSCMDIRFGGASRITGDSSGNVAIANTLHAKRYTETVANAFNTSLAPSTGTLTVDTSLGNAVLGALSASVTTWAFTNVPTDNSKVTTVTAVLAGNASYTYGDACSVNGSAVTNGIMWSGGSAPTATAGTDIITFIIVKDSAGTVKVFGSATTNFS